LAKAIGLKNILNTFGARVSEHVENFSAKTMKLFQKFGILPDDKERETREDGAYELKPKVVGVKHPWANFIDRLAAGVDVEQVRESYGAKVDDGSVRVLHLGTKGLEGFRIRIAWQLC
jgi:hypothetical protein